MKEGTREYNCPKCGKPLIEGLEFAFPPRLSYWYCAICQWVFKETDERVVVAHLPVLHNERLCVRDDNIKGFVENLETGEKIYSDDLPALEIVEKEAERERDLPILEKINKGLYCMDELLGLLKSGPLSKEELMIKSQLPEDKINAIIDFLQKQGLIKVKDDQVEITKSGLSVLELPVVET